MLIVISDIHFNDGSATNNLSPRAFKHFFNFVKRGVRENTKELIIVLAGDTFDLLRTEYWMHVDHQEKPWDANGKNSAHKHFKRIFENILNVNSKSFEILKKTQEVFSPLSVQWVIITGNHDRVLVGLNDIEKTLTNILESEVIILEGYENDEYGVTIRHGHEFDPFNFEPHGIPIGDINTVELFVKIPFLIKQKFPELEDELKSLEDIRPQWRMFDYLLNTYRKKDIKKFIESTIDETVDTFFKIPYVKQWLKEHNTINPFDNSDKLRYMLYLSKIISVDWAEKLLKFFSYFEINEHNYELKASTFKSLYTVFGHTHNEKISFLREEKGLHRYYINTGTWREKIVASRDGMFSKYKSMTYAIFYRNDERDTEFPSFELWNGALRE